MSSSFPAHRYPEILKNSLSRIQQGAIDYKGFLAESGEAGVHHYCIDFDAKKATYENEDCSQAYIEDIPAAVFNI